MRYWDSEEVEVPARDKKPDPVGFMKFLLLALGVFVIFGKPLRVLWSAIGRGISRFR
jgi:hypothetical protein